MNIADIEKVANRKRLIAEAKNLREKVNKETTNIIKLKVAQDTAYSDLKEKFNQLENNHERLQQNMAEVHMQHEAILGQYQDELRLRPETLNKLSSTREICDVLEEYSEQLKSSVSRCKDDQAMLAEAYKKSGQVVTEIKDKQIKSDEKKLQIINNLQNKVKLLVEHKEQMIQVFNTSKQHLDSELKDVQSKLATALGQKDELFVAFHDLSRNLDYAKSELEKKDEKIANLQTEMRKYIDEFNNQITEMKNDNSKQGKQLKECTTANESLKRTVQHQEQFTQSIGNLNNQLQEKISVLEEDQIFSCNKIEDLELKLEESNSQCGKLVKDLKHEIEVKSKLLEESLIEHQHLTGHILTLEELKSETVIELNKVTQESELKSHKIEEMSSVIQELQAKISELENILENNKTENEKQIIDITCTLETKVKLLKEKDKELDCKTSTINQLMSDLEYGVDARIKLESNIEKIKKDMETEKHIAEEKQDALSKKVELMEIATKERESELSKQMSIKERLQDRLKRMRNTIDNIKKAVNIQAAKVDDNAVAINPAPNNKPAQVNRHFDAMPRGEKKQRAGRAPGSDPFKRPLTPPKLKETKVKRKIFKSNSTEDKVKKSKTDEQ